MPTAPRSGSDVAAYILAGGESRRFGSDKARALVRGAPMIVGVAEALAPVSLSVTVVAAHDGAYSDLGLRTIGDVVPGKGPLGGLLTALADHGGPGWILLCACDWTGIRSEWVATLLAARSPDATAVAFRSDRMEPLFGLYHTALRAAIRGRIEANRLAMHDLLSHTPTVVVAAPRDWHRATNRNAPS